MITYSLNKSADNILVRFDYARTPPIENSKNEMEAAYEVPWILYEDRMGRILSLSLLLEHEKIFYWSLIFNLFS